MDPIQEEAQLDAHLQTFYQEINPAIEKAESRSDIECVATIENNDYPALAETYLREEGVIRQALEKFEKKIAMCQIHDGVPPSKRAVLEAKLAYLGSIREKLFNEGQELLNKARIMTFTKYLWNNVKFIRSLAELSFDDPGAIEAMTKIRSKALSWVMETFKQTMYTSDIILKEEVITAFTAYKEAYKEAFSRHLMQSQANREKAYYEAHMPRARTSTNPSSAVEKASLHVFNKKKGKLSLSVGLASLYAADHTKTVATVNGALFATLALPSMILTWRGLLRAHQAHREAETYLKECELMRQNAERMVYEGETLLRAGEGKLSPEIMEKGHRLISVGIEVRERMRMNIDSLTKEKLNYESTMLFGAASSPGLMAGTISKIGKTIETLSHGSKAALKGFTYLGIAGGVGGVLVGGALTYKAVRGIQSRTTEIAHIAAKRRELLGIKSKAFQETEHIFLNEREERAKSLLRAQYITLASSLLVTAVGLIALFSLVNPNWTGDLSLSLLTLSGALSIGNFIYKKTLRKAQSPPEISAIVKEIRLMNPESEDIKKLSAYLEIEDTKAFYHNPEVYLTHHFRS